MAAQRGWRAMALAGVVALCATGGSEARPLDCQGFREALWRAVEDGGDRVALPRLENPQRTPSSATLTDLKGVVGLKGVLRCNPNGTLDSFSVDADLAPDDWQVRYDRLLALGSAAVCAVTSGQSVAACDQIVRRHADAAVREYERAYRRGEEDPTGDSERETLPGGFDLQFEGRAGELSFIVGGPAGATAPTLKNDGASVIPDPTAGGLTFPDSVDPPTARH